MVLFLVAGVYIFFLLDLEVFIIYIELDLWRADPFADPFCVPALVIRVGYSLSFLFYDCGRKTHPSSGIQ